MVCAVIHWPFLIIMRASDRATARKNIDRRLAALGDPQKLSRPPYGWIKAIREALGMTSRQFAKRMGVSQPRASAIEKNEVIGSITLDTLQRAANALECQLVYALVPRKPLQALVKERAGFLMPGLADRAFAAGCQSERCCTDHESFDLHVHLSHSIT